MKKIFIFSALLFAGASFLVAQSITPPKKCADFVAKNFAGATDIEWEKEDGDIIAEFQFNDHEVEVSFDGEDGEHLATLTDLKWSEIPASVMNAHKTSAYGTWTPYEMWKAEGLGAVIYHLEVKSQEGKAAHLIFDNAGKMIGDEEIEAEDEEEDEEDDE